MKRMIFGTMRMLEHSDSVTYWRDYFLKLHEAGIGWLHSSREYASFDLLCAVLEALHEEHPGVLFKHVVKLAEPHFDEANFDPDRMMKKVDWYRQKMGVDSLNEVQWMWRPHLEADEQRILRFRRQKAEISETFSRLKERGVVGRFICFPYTPDFARHALSCSFIDGLAVYRNEAEREYDAIVENGANNKDILVIRPFAAGKGFTSGKTAREMLDYALSPCPVSGAVFTATGQDHFDEIIGYINETFH